MSATEVLIERIHNLLSKTEARGATAAEAAAAARMAAALMQKHAISVAQVRFHADAAGVASVDIRAEDCARHRWEFAGKSVPSWVRSLAKVVSRATGTRFVICGNALEFSGAFEDGAVAIALMGFLYRRVMGDTASFLRVAARNGPSGRSLGHSFRWGWVSGVGQAVDAEMAERNAERFQAEAKRADGSTALVVMSGDLVARAKEAAIDAYIASTYRSLRPLRQRPVGVFKEAYGAGQSRGRSVRVGSGANLN